MGDLTIRAKPFNDAEVRFLLTIFFITLDNCFQLHLFQDLLPLCYRCSTTNPLANPKGNQCINCQQEFVYSFATFDVLPIVKFDIEEGITDQEAIQLIEKAVPDQSRKRRTSGKKNSRKQTPQDSWQEERSSNFQSLKIRDESNYEASDEGDFDSLQRQESDPFTIQMSSLEAMEGTTVIADHDILSSLRSSEVFIASPPEPLRKVFYKNLVPEMSIIMCPSCHKFFLEDFESHILQDSKCSFCRNKLDLRQ